MTTKPITACGAALVLALSLVNIQAQIYTNPLDDKTGWDGVGGSAGPLTTWTIDNTVVAPGSTGSWYVSADFSEGTYADIYTQGSFGTWDFSTNTFSLWLRTSVTNAPLLWRLGHASSGTIFEVAATSTQINTWQQFTFNANQFTGTLENLTNVNFMQLRFIGDNLGGGSADFYVDQMNIVPEPSTIALLALSALGVGGLAWRKRQRQSGRMSIPVILAAVLVMAWSVGSARAGEIVLDAAQIAAQGVGSKGASCPSSKSALEAESGKLLWTIEASPEKSFDFGKLEIPAAGEVTPATIVTLEAGVELAPQSYLEIGLQLADGRYFFSNLKASEVVPAGSYAFPLAKMASSDGKPFTDPSAQMAGVTLMVNSDASDAAGVSKIRIARIAVSP